MALHWTHSRMYLILWYWGTHHRTQHSRCTSPVLSSPGSCSPSLPQGHIAVLWPTFCPLGPPGPFSWVAFQLVSLQHARAVPPQEQDLPLPFLEFHEVPFSPFLYPNQITKKSTLCTVALFWWNILRKTISEFLLFHFMYLINPRTNVNHKYIQMDP